MTFPLDAVQLHDIQMDAAPKRSIAQVQAKYVHQPMTQRTVHMLHEDAIQIWEEHRARGDMLPSGNDLQCLLLMHRIANQMKAHGLHVPDFLFLSVSEYEEAQQLGAAR